MGENGLDFVRNEDIFDERRNEARLARPFVSADADTDYSWSVNALLPGLGPNDLPVLMMNPVSASQGVAIALASQENMQVWRMWGARGGAYADTGIQGRTPM